MYDIEKSLNSQIIELGRERPTVFFTEASDPRQLEAICFLTRFIRPVLPASEEEVRTIIKSQLPHIRREQN